MSLNSLIVKVANLFKKSTSPLPITENVALTGISMIFTDLNYFISIPYKTAFKTSFPIRSLIAALETFTEPVFSLKADKISISQGKEVIKTSMDNLDNYPALPKYNHKSSVLIGTITPEIMSFLLNAVQFISHDDLRPAMEMIQIHTHIAATDAHRLYFKKLDIPFIQEILIPAYVVKALDIFKGSGWDVFIDKKVSDGSYKNDYHTALLRNEDGVEISFTINGLAFPNWKVVVPAINKTTPFVMLNRSELRKAIKTGKKFGNPITKEARITISKTGSTYHVEDIDMGNEYETELTLPNVKTDISIYINWDFLDMILRMGDDLAMMHYTEPRKAVIFNKEVLLMPIMHAQ